MTHPATATATPTATATATATPPPRIGGPGCAAALHEAVTRGSGPPGTVPGSTMDLDPPVYLAIGASVLVNAVAVAALLPVRRRT